MLRYGVLPKAHAHGFHIKLVWTAGSAMRESPRTAYVGPVITCETIPASIKALRNPQHWQRVMAVEANLTLDMFNRRLSEYTSGFGGVRLATSERTSIDSCEPLPYRKNWPP
jgi:hypothetical protein